MPLTFIFYSLFFRSRRLVHSEVKAYAALTLQRKDRAILCGGMLIPKEGKQILIHPAGTKAFEELNTLLMQQFPRGEKG